MAVNWRVLKTGESAGFQDFLPYWTWNERYFVVEKPDLSYDSTRYTCCGNEYIMNKNAWVNFIEFYILRNAIKRIFLQISENITKNAKATILQIQKKINVIFIFVYFYLDFLIICQEKGTKIVINGIFSCNYCSFKILDRQNSGQEKGADYAKTGSKHL